ncbi:hypothetical protein V2W45_595767 [Cenococcum geophilum]
MSLPVELRLQIYEYIFGVTSARQSTTIRYTLCWTYMDIRRNSLKRICLCPGRDDGRPHNYLRRRCNGPHVRFLGRKEFRNIDESKVDAYLHAITPGNDILRVSQRTHAEALPILYRSRNFKFCGGEYFGADSLYSIAFFISSLSQYAKPHLQELTISFKFYWYDETPHRYRRSFADFCDLISSELKGLQKLNIEFGLVYSTMLVNLSRRSVRKKATNLENIRTQKGSFNQKYWWVDGAHVLGPFAALLRGNPELTLSITSPMDNKPYIPKLCGVDDEETFKKGSFYLNQEQVNRFFAKIDGKRYARKARKAAGEGGMELPEGLEEFLLSCQDSM